MHALSALWILGCASPEPAAHVYLQAATASTGAEVRQLCARLGPEESECLAMGAAQHAEDPAAALPLCEAVTDEVWRDECFFLVAEAQVTRAGPESAAQSCAQAGRFTANCVMHVWKGHARQLLTEDLSLEQAATAFGPALDWAPESLPVDTALTRRFWSVLLDVWVYEAEDTPVVDLADCASLPSTEQQFCRQVLPSVLTRALNRVDHHGDVDPTALCTEGSLPERIESATGIRYRPHAQLDAIATRFVERICQRGPRP